MVLSAARIAAAFLFLAGSALAAEARLQLWHLRTMEPLARRGVAASGQARGPHQKDKCALAAVVVRQAAYFDGAKYLEALYAMRKRNDADGKFCWK